MNWTTHLDPRTKRTYYFNKQTGQTSWDQPVLQGPRPDAAVESKTTATGSWTSHVDKKSGRVYYHNRLTNETSWTNPSSLQAQKVPASNAQQVVLKTDAHGAADARVARKVPMKSGRGPIRQGWAAHVDKKSGKTYYYNPETGQTAWVRPGAQEQRGSPKSSESVAQTEISLVESQARAAEQKLAIQSRLARMLASVTLAAGGASSSTSSSLESKQSVGRGEETEDTPTEDLSFNTRVRSSPARHATVQKERSGPKSVHFGQVPTAFSSRGSKKVVAIEKGSFVRPGMYTHSRTRLTRGVKTRIKTRLQLFADGTFEFQQSCLRTEAKSGRVVGDTNTVTTRGGKWVLEAPKSARSLRLKGRFQTSRAQGSALTRGAIEESNERTYPFSVFKWEDQAEVQQRKKAHARAMRAAVPKVNALEQKAKMMDEASDLQLAMLIAGQMSTKMGSNNASSASALKSMLKGENKALMHALGIESGTAQAQGMQKRVATMMQQQQQRRGI